MRRKSPPKSAANVALFPFLAVLLCTMGALILLLVVIARQAQQQAAALSAGSTDQQKAAQETMEDLEWTAARLRESRDNTTAQLAEERMKLSHIEDHARRLREQLAELASAADQLQQTDQLDQQGRQRKRTEIATLKAKMARAKSDLENALAANKGTTEAYAIIPFAGKNGTRRRPIYIECRADGVILQPEGIVLSETDFILANSAINPLAASLRAAREYLSRNRRLDDNTGEPYPLLLVRPNGIGAYWAARAAMMSWGDEFGYELVDQDWKLDFPAADIGLQNVLKLAVGESRRKQELLVQQAPRLYKGMAPPSFQNPPDLEKQQRRSGGKSDQLPGLASRGRRNGSGGNDMDGYPSGDGRANTSSGRYSLNPYASITGGSGNGAGGLYPGGSGTLPGNGSAPSSSAAAGLGPTGQYAMGGPSGSNPYSLTSTSAGPSSAGGPLSGLGDGRGTGNYSGPGGVNGMPGASGFGTGGTSAGPGGAVGGMAGGPGSGQGISGSGSPALGGGPSLGAAGNLPSGSGSGAENGMGNGGAGNSGAGNSGSSIGNSGSGGSGSSSGASGGAPGSSALGQSAAGAGGMPMGSSGSANTPGLNLSMGGGQGQANQNNASGTSGANGANQAGGGSSSPQGTAAANNTLASAGTAAGTSNWGQNRTGRDAAAATASTPDSQQVQPGLYRPGATSATGMAGSTPDSRTLGSKQANSTQMRRGGSSGGASASGGKTPSGSSVGNQGDDDESLTKQRRKNWGLRGATHAVAVSRPILLECHSDHLTIVPDRPGSRTGKIVPLEGRTSESVDELVSGIWEQIDTWGIAGNNMYWKPTLAMQVFPGGEQRYADLQRLLADSGLDLKQRAAPAAPPRPPATVPLVQPRTPTGFPYAYPRTNTPN